MNEGPAAGTKPAATAARYTLLCVALGLVLGWVPAWLHGPIPGKFDVLYIRGAIAVWGWYVARMSIGFWVGVAVWPRAWWLRGPLLGALCMLPLTLVSLAMPACGWPCMAVNLASGAGVGAAVAGIARALTGLAHR
jgi:hypothetical protein